MTEISNNSNRSGGFMRNPLESKTINNLKPLTGDKGMFRQWNQKFISAVYTINNEYGDAMKNIEKELDMGSKTDEV